jgi:hypothetical protein
LPPHIPGQKDNNDTTIKSIEIVGIWLLQSSEVSLLRGVLSKAAQPDLSVPKNLPRSKTKAPLQTKIAIIFLRVYNILEIAMNKIDCIMNSFLNSLK